MTQTKTKKIDLRKLPKDKRPKPHTGQSRPHFKLKPDELTKREVKILTAVKKHPDDMSVADISKSSRLTKLQVRNAIRRLIPGDWLAHIRTKDVSKARGHYRLTARARHNLAELL